MAIFGVFGMFGVIELLFLSVFFIMMVVGCTLDRTSNREGDKWWVISVAIVAAMAWYWSDFTFYQPVEGKITLLQAGQTMAFWSPVAIYFGLGLIYSLVEFFFDLRRKERFYAETWKSYLNETTSVRIRDDVPEGRKKSVETTNGVLLRKALGLFDFVQTEQTQADYTADMHEGEKVAEKFITSHRVKNCIVEVELTANKLGIRPRINRMELTDHITAWTLMWPFYLVSMIVGDLLTEVFRAIGDFIANFSGRMVRLMFAKTFEV